MKSAPIKLLGFKCGSGDWRAGEDTRPYRTYRRRSGECRRGRRPRRPAGAQCAPLRLKRVALITKTVPLIRLAALGTFPQGKAFGRPQGSLLRRNWTGAVGRDSQAQLRNCTSLQFLDSQGPVARLEFRHALRFCAPELFCPPQGITPVNGVRGKATMSTKCSSGAVPGDPLVSFPSLGKKLAPQGEIPLRTTNAVRNLPPHPAPSGPPSPQGEGLKRGGEIPPKKNTPISL